MSDTPFKIVHPTVLWAISQRIAAVVTHWTGGRTQWCRRDAGEPDCIGCREGQPAEAEYWLLCQDERARSKPRLLKITPGAMGKALGLWERDGTLWGTRLVVSRAGCRPGGAMAVVATWPRDLPGLVGPREVLPHLRRLWDAPSRHAGN
jgi:hypothetical protein